MTTGDVRKISLTQALRELKLLDSRITRAINNGSYISAAKKSSKTIALKNIPREVFEANAKADYQSVMDLIENRKRIKSKIVQSNATTFVTIGQTVYTVAEAIERKNSIDYEHNLLDAMKKQYYRYENLVATSNEKVDAQLDKMLEAYVGKDTDKKIAEADFSAITEPYRAQNEWELVDPLDLLKKIEALEVDIEDFESNVDTCLSMSNAVTFIEV